MATQQDRDVEAGQPREASGSTNIEKCKPFTPPIESYAKGYPRLAAFLSSDRKFMHYRGFHGLHSRVLLAQQHDIEALEEELDTIDEWDKDSATAHFLRDQTRDDGRNRASMIPDYPETRTRPEVIAELKKKLVEYDKMLLYAKAIAGLPCPSSKDWRSVSHWMYTTTPLVTREQKFILRKEDLVTLNSGRQSTGFEDLVEQLIAYLDGFLTKLNCDVITRTFVTPEQRQKTSDKRISFHASERVDKLANVIITAVIFALLVLPVVVMYELSSASDQTSPFTPIGVLIVFTLLFCVAMHGLTQATRQELFAATAAYCAVLVVFLSNFSTQTVKVVQ